MLLKIAVTEGNRKALVLDAETLKQLNASDTSEFEVSRNGNVIELRPVPFDRKAHIRALAQEVMTAHDETFNKLSK